MRPETKAAGHVTTLWRYPVKSMLGEKLGSLRLDARGVVGDRLWGVRTTDGKLGSGKTTRRFGHVDRLLELRSWYDGDTPCIALPSGEIARGDAANVDALLTEATGQRIWLVREAGVSHLDSSPVHLLTTASLRWLENCVGDGAADARRFRPNIVLDAPGNVRVEDGWIGHTLRIGGAELRVTAKTVRCVMTTFSQEDLGPNADVLKTLARENEACLGVYADVVRVGDIRLGDAALLE